MSSPAVPQGSTGQLIAHDRVARPLGSGGMGEVFLAEDTRLDRFIALKLLPREVAANYSAPARTPELPTKDSP